MKKEYTIQLRPVVSGEGYTATIIELGVTVAGTTQFEAWNAAHRVIFGEVGRLYEEAKARRWERQEQRKKSRARALEPGSIVLRRQWD